jgi:hypothetical protein
MEISIKIKRQASKENPHHNRCCLNFLLIQSKNLLSARKKKKEKGKEAREREITPLRREINITVT